MCRMIHTIPTIKIHGEEFQPGDSVRIVGTRFVRGANCQILSNGTFNIEGVIHEINEIHWDENGMPKMDRSITLSIPNDSRLHGICVSRIIAIDMM